MPRGASLSQPLSPRHSGRTTGRRAPGLLAVVALLLSMCSAPSLKERPNGLVSVRVSSAAGDRLASKPALRFGPRVAPEDRPLITVDDSVHHQRIQGFGASFLEAGLVTLDTLPRRSDQNAVLKAL